MKIISLVPIPWLGVSSQISRFEPLSPIITIYITTSQVYSQKLAYLGKKSLIPIRQQILYYKNLPISSLSIFLWSDRGGSNLLNMFEWSEKGRFDLNKVEGNAVCEVQCVWLDVGSAVSGLVLSIFQRRVGSIMGFAFFLSSSSCILKA